MTTDEWHAFVLASPARTAALAVKRADGRPFVAPIWVTLDGDDVIFTTGADTLKGKAVRRDAHVCLMFDDERPPFSFVILEGTVTISEDLDDLLLWSTRIAGRYMGDDVAEQYGRRNAVPGELLVRVTPTRVRAESGIAD
jgi:PPOX class probable F420-dependent enzyme